MTRSIIDILADAERMAAARLRRWQARQRRMETMAERYGDGYLPGSSSPKQLQIKMRVTPWTVDEFGNRTRWAFQEGDHPL